MKKKIIYFIIKYISVLNNSILKTELIIVNKLKYAVEIKKLDSEITSILRSLGAIKITTKVTQALLDALENTSKDNLNTAIEYLNIFVDGFLLKFKDNIYNDNNEIYLLVSYTQEIKDLLRTELDNLKEKNEN